MRLREPYFISLQLKFTFIRLEKIWPLENMKLYNSSEDDWCQYAISEVTLSFFACTYRVLSNHNIVWCHALKQNFPTDFDATPILTTITAFLLSNTDLFQHVWSYLLWNMILFWIHHTIRTHWRMTQEHLARWGHCCGKCYCSYCCSPQWQSYSPEKHQR